ncbi:MAG TPA: outer membrane lipoprotein carrier protein LolA, partial [Tepidisphaeraceae bacterium]
MRWTLRAICSVAAFFILSHARLSAQATQPSPDASLPTTRATLEVVQHLQKQLHGINTVDSDFVETKKLAMLNHTLVIKGHVGLAKPDRLIWIVRQPVRYAVRIEGDEVQQWDEDTNKVETIHLGGDPTFRAISQQIQAWFLGDYKLLGDNYDLYVTQQQPLSLAFMPHGDSAVTKLIKRIDLTFIADETYIDTM